QEPRYRVHLGTAYFMVGQLQKAEEQFKKSLELDADYKDAYRQLGRLYM
ncbi:MAG: tetratricopeptide repeat protein, partial [Nitrospinaceae bacterium]|nr:tetratricopeptide repeat protein [Nitrospinaceae bacterium]NIR53280.1 tetratricopeptide repeat protein [Nitrospinaceae bacterium]NIS83681.1 tetratricopeptide repeat protein [Nitrospinaceae bacterium]NIT80480.1 tetratricopeptide repeat protein [Nitrospinaceae bacterium]NIU42808.1 tetratricopeptide repeat protein [Nitrospinaceae bacterium]